MTSDEMMQMQQDHLANGDEQKQQQKPKMEDAGCGSNFNTASSTGKTTEDVEFENSDDSSENGLLVSSTKNKNKSEEKLLRGAGEDKEEEIEVEVEEEGVKAIKAEEGEEEGIGRWSAAAMVVNLYMGSSIVTLPAAIAIGGYASTLFIAMMGIVAAITGLQLVKGFDMTSSMTYFHYAERVGGKSARVIVTIFITGGFILATIENQLLLFQVAVSFLDILGIEGGDQQLAIVTITTILTLALVGLDTVNPMYLVRMGKFATGIVVVLVIGIIVSCSVILKENLSKDCSTVEFYRQDGSIIGVMATAAAGFSGHAGLPHVYRRMANPTKDFPFVIHVVFTAMVLLYCGIGILGYSALGNECELYANVLDYFPKIWKSPKGNGLNLVLIVLFYIKVQLVQPAMVEIMTETGEKLALKLMGVVLDDDRPIHFQRVVYRFICFLLTLAASVFLVNFGTEQVLIRFVAFDGAFSVIPEVYVLPSSLIMLLLYKQRSTHHVGWKNWSFNGTILIIAWAIFIVSIYYFIQIYVGEVEVQAEELALEEDEVPCGGLLDLEKILPHSAYRISSRMFHRKNAKMTSNP